MDVDADDSDVLDDDDDDDIEANDDRNSNFSLYYITT